MEEEKQIQIQQTESRFSRATDDLFNQFKNSFFKIADIGTSQKRKFVNYVGEIFDVLPIVEEAGFRPQRSVITISIPPSVEIYFARYKEIDPKQIEQLKEKHKSKMFRLILKPLLMANELQGKFSTEDMVFAETGIEITIPPKVMIKYLNKEIAHLTKLEARLD